MAGRPCNIPCNSLSGTRHSLAAGCSGALWTAPHKAVLRKLTIERHAGPVHLGGRSLFVPVSLLKNGQEPVPLGNALHTIVRKDPLKVFRQVFQSNQPIRRINENPLY